LGVVRLQLAPRPNLEFELDVPGHGPSLEPLGNGRNGLLQDRGKRGLGLHVEMGFQLVRSHHNATLRNAVMDVKRSGGSFYGRPFPTVPTIYGMGVGQRIKALRLAMGLEQGQLAKQARIKQSTLSDLERGDSKNPRGDTLVQIASVLKVDHDWLMTGEGMPQRKMQPDIEQSELLTIFISLNSGNKGALLAAARALLDSQPDPTSASPFKRQQKKHS
jgi:transcriptional regulator with XRE-family HTH domain